MIYILILDNKKVINKNQTFFSLFLIKKFAIIILNVLKIDFLIF